MRKIAMISAAFMVLAPLANAQYVGPNAADVQQNGKYAAKKVGDVLSSAKDDEHVSLTGQLTRKLSDEHYMFTDGTGEIRVEIDDDDFPRVEVTESTTVTLYGEVDTHRRKPTDIDVDYIEVHR